MKVFGRETEVCSASCVGLYCPENSSKDIRLKKVKVFDSTEGVGASMIPACVRLLRHLVKEDL